MLKTLHKCTPHSVQQKSTLLSLVSFMKNSALQEHNVTAEFNAKN